MGKIFIVGEVVYWDHKCCELDDYDDYETRMYKIGWFNGKKLSIIIAI